MRQHLRNTHTSVRIHPETSIHTPTCREARARERAHTHTRTHQVSPPTGCTHLLRHSHSHTLTYALRDFPTLHILRLSSNFPSTITSCHLHIHPHMFMSTGSHTYTRMHTFSQSHNLGGKPQAPTCMRGTSTKAADMPAWTPCTLAHTSTSAHILVFTLKSSPGSKTQTLKMCLSLATLCQS